MIFFPQKISLDTWKLVAPTQSKTFWQKSESSRSESEKIYRISSFFIKKFFVRSTSESVECSFDNTAEKFSPKARESFKKFKLFRKFFQHFLNFLLDWENALLTTVPKSFLQIFKRFSFIVRKKRRICFFFTKKMH